MKNEKVAKELMRIARHLIFASEREDLEKKFDKLVLDGSVEAAKEYADLCEEWKKQFPDEMPPVPGQIKI